MRIAVNTRLLLSGRLEGIGWYSYETLKRITQNHPEHEFIFIFDRKYSDEFIFSDNITPVILPPQARHPFLWKIWLDYSIPYVLKKYRADVFLSTDGFLSLRTKVPSVPVIHDINFVHRKEDFPGLVGKYYNRHFPKFAKLASRVVTVSEYSKTDICNSFGIEPEKVTVSHNGAGEVYAPIDMIRKKEIKRKYTQGEDFFIFIGALNPRKNVAGLLKAYDRFKKITGSKIKLVIVGSKMFRTQDIEEVFNSMNHADDVVFTGRLSQKDLHLVLASATALTFVPFFEGFGIPIVEAMYCDVPVLCSNTTSMPEVAGDAAVYVDPNSIESISNGMIQMLLPEEQERLINNAGIQRQKFSWDKTAESLWSAVDKTICEIQR